MRCLSPFANYSIQIFEGQEQLEVDARGFGATRVVKQPVIANFERLGLLDYEEAEVLMKFNFSGIPEGVNPLSRVSCFDTEGYVQRYPAKERDEMLIQIDQRLREKQEMFPTQFIIVDTPAAAKPWPSYDDDGVEDVLKLQERLRVDPTLIRKYEEENKKREEIIEQMLALVAPDGAPQPPAVAVEKVPEPIVVRV